MAQYSKGRGNWFPSGNSDVFEVGLLGTKDGTVVSNLNRLPVEIRQVGKTAFGESSVAELSCVVQLEAIHGIENENAVKFQTYSALGGVAETEDNMFKVSSSATTYSYGVLRSKRFLRYRPGQGALGRFSARFDTPAADTSQRAGLFNQESAFMVGYNGTEFGLLHSYGAKSHIHEFTIVTPPSASTDATIVLNDVIYTVPLVAAETIYQTASRIARFPFPGWIAEQKDNRIIFLATAVGPKLGADSFTHATATATGIHRAVGVAATDVWIKQEDWNGLDGVGKSINWLPGFFNVYQIQYRWLGAGIIKFSAEHPDTGEWVELHTIHWVNKETTLSIGDPSMKIGLVSYNLGGGAKSVYIGSMMMAIEGKIITNDYPKSISGTQSSLSANIIHHIVSVKNPITRGGVINTKEIILQDLTVSSQGQDPTEILLFINPTNQTGAYDFRSMVNALASVDNTDAKTFSRTIDPTIVSVTIGINGNGQFPLSDYRIVLDPGDVISVGVRCGAVIQKVIASLTWTTD
tara:strand:+ start:148 stop:1710 length:1563 start_codon:yes stop_codon:yes gene_type:complete